MKSLLYKKLIFAALCGIMIGVLFAYRVSIKETVVDFFKPPLPQPKSAVEFTETAPPDVVIEQIQPQPKQELQTVAEPLAFLPESEIPTSINLDIPFASQAPHQNWNLPYKEACEEAAMIMAHRFLNAETLNADTMNEEILKLVDWQKKTFGYYEDTTAKEMARTLREYFGHTDVEVRYEFTIEDIKAEIKSGYPVILPAAGRLLPNPNFRSPGPLYHALVVKGYTQKHIITNDPGTRKGKDFLYEPDALMNAIHDWNPKNILEGRKAIIVVRG